MSEDFNTKDEENLNGEKKTIRITISAETADEFLNKIDAPFPSASEIDEIVLVIG